MILGGKAVKYQNIIWHEILLADCEISYRKCSYSSILARNRYGMRLIFEEVTFHETFRVYKSKDVDFDEEM